MSLLLFQRGLIHVYKEEWNEAKLCFQNSVAVNPRHIKSLQQLGLIYHYLGSQRVAETTLRDACKIDPTSHQTWYVTLKFKLTTIKVIYPIHCILLGIF